MNRDDVTVLAELAGIKNDCDGIWCEADQLQRFARLVAKHERERCARLVETFDTSNPNLLAVAIRARGEK